MCSGFWETLRAREEMLAQMEKNVEEYFEFMRTKEVPRKYREIAEFIGAFDLD